MRYHWIVLDDCSSISVRPTPFPTNVAPRSASLCALILVLKPHDIIFTEIVPGLNFDYL